MTEDAVCDSDSFEISIDVFTLYFIDTHTCKLTALTPDEQDAVIKFHFDKLKEQASKHVDYIGMLNEK